MSDQSVARKIQKELGVKYQKALTWVREAKPAAADIKTANLEKPFSECIIEVVKRDFYRKDDK